MGWVAGVVGPRPSLSSVWVDGEHLQREGSWNIRHNHEHLLVLRDIVAGRNRSRPREERE